MDMRINAERNVWHLEVLIREFNIILIPCSKMILHCLSQFSVEYPLMMVAKGRHM